MYGIEWWAGSDPGVEDFFEDREVEVSSPTLTTGSDFVELVEDVDESLMVFAVVTSILSLKLNCGCLLPSW